MDDLLAPLAELESQGAQVLAMFSWHWVAGGLSAGLLIGFAMGRMGRIAYERATRFLLHLREKGQPRSAEPRALIAWQTGALTEASNSLLSIAEQVVAPANLFIISLTRDRRFRLEHEFTTPHIKPLALKTDTTTWPKKWWRRIRFQKSPWTLAVSQKGATQVPYLMHPQLIKAVLIAPIRTDEQLVGLFVIHRAEGDLFTNSEKKLSGRIAQQIALAIGQQTALRAQEDETRARAKALARMEHLATHDGLTGLVNHRHFKALFDSYLAQAERYGRRLSLMMLDIDHFKRINDQYGHPVGDRVLKEIANVLLASARRADIVARLGGEEFAILMEETGAGGAHNIAERIRCSVMASIVKTSFGDIQTTLSLGIASFPSDGRDKESLLQHADDALYEAKKTGRNKTVLFQNSSSPTENVTPP